MPQGGGSLANAILLDLGGDVNEAGLKDPKYSRFGEHIEVSNHSKGSSMFILRYNSD